MGQAVALAALVYFVPTVAPVPVEADPPLRVLYVEGQPRWEYRFLSTALVRAKAKDRAVVDLHTLLLDADPAARPKGALAKFPARNELFGFDLIIVGDVPPKALGAEALAGLRDFVREGGSVLVIAGRAHGPHALKGTPLGDVLPVELGDPPAKPKEDEKDKPKPFRLAPTAAGAKHPAFLMNSDGKKNRLVWEQMPEAYARAGGIKLRVKATMLAELDGGPVVAEHEYGKGRCAFVGFDETWRWRYNGGDIKHARFWFGMLKSLAAGRNRPLDAFVASLREAEPE